MEQCRFPDALEIATVVIPKKGNSELVTNLCPISLIPCTGKIMEIFLNRFLVNFMEEDFMKYLTKVAIYPELAKTFNTVNHNIL